jgi:hypothetical protein
MLRRALALGFGVLLIGCGDPAGGTTVEPVYVVPASLDALAETTFFDHPFPSDLRRPEGKVRFAGWPNPKAVPLLAEYIGFIDGQLDGFSPVATGFARFDGALDPATLPPDAEVPSPVSSVQLIDVDPSSPERGQRRPIYVTFRAEPGIYWQENTLAFMPVPGLPLRPHTRYAFVATDALKPVGGGEVVASATLKQALGIEEPGAPEVTALRDAIAPDVAEVEADGVAKDRIVHFSVFTTDDPADEYLAAAGALKDQIAAPTADPGAWKLEKVNADYDEYLGDYGPSPNYQAGQIPYSNFGDGGGFAKDASGIPQVQNEFDLRFSLSVPNATKCPMPQGGYPIVLYAHGTTGDYRSYVYDGTARSLAKQCLATMGVDQIFHGTRPGAPESDTSKEILFFNFNNVEAARTNARQSGLDEIQRARLFIESALTVPAMIATTGADIRFDASRLMFFGHSQGSLNGPLFMAGSDAPRGAVLSGASGLMQVTLLEKTQPEPSVATLVKTVFLQLLLDEEGEVGLLYPPLSLAQSIIDPVDPINYAASIATEPKFGGPKSVLVTEGVRADGTGDSYAPPRGCEAFARAAGLPLADPVVHPLTDGHAIGVTIPPGGLSGNLGGGQASGVLQQWDPGTGEGHFVVFDIDAATLQAAVFLRNLADDPKGNVPAP